ncbi:MAG: peptide-N4-(N-acetyl-beta- glucosaminyl)asparagine amidase [Geoglossum simile]|nr:MAG: peptide-N4-(N-acetyl-beta- glucosaminyl)asparagine amidase [Geoglossum simile]
MNAQVGNPLVNFLGIEPRWPDPKESIGDFIKLIDGKNNCWQAKGRAREAFEDLAVDIKTHLDNNVDSIPGSDWVTWSIYMIGKTQQRAAPVVMFFCEKPRPRREAQEAIKRSGILERYPGIKSGNAALPPDLDQLKPLASDAVYHEDAARTEGSSLNSVISVLRNTVFVTSHHGNISSTWTATLGGIVQHNGDTYVFTAGHPFNETTPLSPLKEPKGTDEEWEIDGYNNTDSDTEVDIYGEEFVEAMSRASNTPVDARSETSSCLDDSSSDTYSTRSLQLSDISDSIEDQFFGQQSQTQAASYRAVRNWAFEDTIPAMDVHNFEQNAGSIPTSVATKGHLAVLSADFDYALIKFNDPNLLAAGVSAGNKSVTNLLRPTHVITTGPRDTEIIAYTASGGLMTGTLYGTPSYTRLPKSKTFQEVYTVRFNGPVAKGDCGSWVIDAETRGLYGHIIAGCERTGTAYIMSAHNAFKNAKERLGGEVLLECDRTSEAISPTDPTEIAEAALAEELAIPYFHLPTFKGFTPQTVDFPVKHVAQSQLSSSHWIPDNPISLLHFAYSNIWSRKMPAFPSSLTTRFLTEDLGTADPFGTKRRDRTAITHPHGSSVEAHPYNLTKHEKTRSRLWGCVEEGYRYHQTDWPTERKRGRCINDKHSATLPLHCCPLEPCSHVFRRRSDLIRHAKISHDWEYGRSMQDSRMKSEPRRSALELIGIKEVKSNSDGLLPSDNATERELRCVTPFQLEEQVDVILKSLDSHYRNDPGSGKRYWWEKRPYKRYDAYSTESMELFEDLAATLRRLATHLVESPTYLEVVRWSILHANDGVFAAPGSGYSKNTFLSALDVQVEVARLKARSAEWEEAGIALTKRTRMTPYTPVSASNHTALVVSKRVPRVSGAPIDESFIWDVKDEKPKTREEPKRSQANMANINNPFLGFTRKRLAEDVMKFTGDYNLGCFENPFVHAARIARDSYVAESIPDLTEEEKAVFAKEINRGFWEQTKGLKVAMLTCSIAAILQYASYPPL